MLPLTFCCPQDSQLSPVGRMLMPRPSVCHTSSLQTPMDKEQALQVSVSGFTSPASDSAWCCVNDGCLRRPHQTLLLFSVWSLRSRTCCPWPARCSEPGPSPCRCCPTPPRACLSRPRAPYPTESRSWRSIPRPWETAWTSFRTGWVLRGSL